MKIVYLLILALFVNTNIYGESDELLKAYKREFAFLKEQKESLKYQLSKLEKMNKSSISEARKEVDKLQSTLLGYNLKIESEQDKLNRIEINRDVVSDDNSIVENAVMQMRSSLKESGLEIIESENSSEILKDGFGKSIPLLHKLQSITKERGNFYLKDGSQVSGEIIRVGNVASFGVSSNMSGALAPAGSGNLKLWNEPLSEITAKALYNGENPKELNIFIYESLEKEVAEKSEKTIYSIIESGGIVGLAIIGLGVIALVLAILRTLLLIASNTDTKNRIASILPHIHNHDLESAKESLSRFSGATARVLQATIRNIHRDRDFLEDIIAENILNESSKIDRFGSVILVIAAVAPLLGLLGTVTGMISTFDVITEFGTGDPKLLAGGISEALVTTELGLIVAIPALLLGNLLGGWGNSIKDSMEQNALHIVNQYQKSRKIES
jgi:biopolymer transport protein ExbB